MQWKTMDQSWQDSLGIFSHVSDQEWVPTQPSDRENRMCQGVVGRSPSRTDVWGTTCYRPTVSGLYILWRIRPVTKSSWGTRWMMSEKEKGKNGIWEARRWLSGKGTCCQVWCPEFKPWDLSSRREQAPTSVLWPPQNAVYYLKSSL